MFEETHADLGVETQRQWSDKATRLDAKRAARHLNSLSKTQISSDICAATFSAIASGTPTRRSSTPVAMPGTPSWPNPRSSPQLERENGHRLKLRAIGISDDLRNNAISWRVVAFACARGRGSEGVQIPHAAGAGANGSAADSAGVDTLAGPVHFGAALLRGQANPLTVDHDEGVVDLLEVEGVKLRCGCLY